MRLFLKRAVMGSSLLMLAAPVGVTVSEPADVKGRACPAVSLTSVVSLNRNDAKAMGSRCDCDCCMCTYDPYNSTCDTPDYRCGCAVEQ